MIIYDLNRVMDINLQILKHLPRNAYPTISFIDEYCVSYKDLFKEVRNYECFKYLHMGIISPIKRKSLPEIAKFIGIKSEQSLHHFISNSSWLTNELKDRRLYQILKTLNGNPIVVVIDETGYKKKGKKTEYVAKQYLRHSGEIDYGIVSVNAYGIYSNITFPLITKLFKPMERLKLKDEYKTKLDLSSEILEELLDKGFNIKLVCINYLDAIKKQFIKSLEKNKLDYIILNRNTYEVFSSLQEMAIADNWYKNERAFSSEESRLRYIKRVIPTIKETIKHQEINTFLQKIIGNSSSFIITNIKCKSKSKIGNLYNSIIYFENNFQNHKKELGWTNYRFTKFQNIEKWWEIIFCAYTMITLKTQPFLDLKKSHKIENNVENSNFIKLFNHQKNFEKCEFKSTLNNLRFLLDSYTASCR